MDEKTLSFIPQFASNIVTRTVADLNGRLAKLREFVLNHGEDFEDVLQYVERGADHYVRERKAECVAHLDKLGTPGYLRESQIKAAIDDLGAENLAYWRELAPLLRVNLYNTTNSPTINLAHDVDVLPDSWRVKKAWIDAKIEEYRVTLEDWQVSDMEDFIALGKLANKLDAHGYEVTALLTCRPGEFPGSVDEIDKEAFTDLYDRNSDSRLSKQKK